MFIGVGVRRARVEGGRGMERANCYVINSAGLMNTNKQL